MTVELIESKKGFETFKIYPVNDPSKFVQVKGNRPLIRAKGLDKFPIKWQVIKGDIKYQRNLEHALQAIEKHLEPPPVKKKTKLPFPKPPEDRKKNRPQSGWTMGDNEKA